MFVHTTEDEKSDSGVAKTSDPDKFVQLAIKSSDSLRGKQYYIVKRLIKVNSNSCMDCFRCFYKSINAFSCTLTLSLRETLSLNK